MKRILTILILFVCGTASAQVYQRMPQYGYEMQRAKMDSVLQVPGDTVRNKTGVARIGTKLYAGNGTYWTEAGGTTIDTTGIRLQATAGPGISISGTYPNLTFAGNPDTLSATDPLQLTQVSTKRLRLDFRRDWLDSLLALQVDSSGLLDSALLRGDSLFTYTGGVESYRGKVSGGGGGTLQGIMTGSNRNASAGTIILGSNTGSIPSASSYVIAIGDSAAYSELGNMIAIGASAGAFPSSISGIHIGDGSGYGNNCDSCITIGKRANAHWDSQIENSVAIGTGALVTASNSIVLGGIAGVNSVVNSAKVGIGTTGPENTLHIVATDSNAIRIVAPFSNTELSTDSALVIGTDGNVKKAAKASGGFTDTTSLSNRINAKANIESPTFTGSISLSSTTGGIGLPAMTQTQMNAISAPAVGVQVYNTTYDAVCTNTADFGWWSNDAAWQRANGFNYHEEFLINTTSANGLIYGYFTGQQNNSSALQNAVATSNRPGILQLSTQTSATGRPVLVMDLVASRTNILGGGKIIYETQVQIPTLSSASETFNFFTGLSSSTSNVSTNAIAFLYDSAGTNTGSAAIGRWQVVCSNGSNRSYTTTNVQVTAGQWYSLRAVINAAGTQVDFYINGTLVKSETNNIPTGGVSYTYALTKTNGTTARAALVDYFFIRQKFTTTR